jgi:hypothetical protein
MNYLAQRVLAAVIAIAFAGILYFDTFSLTFAGYLLPRILSGVIIVLAIAMVLEAYICSCKQANAEQGPMINKKRVFFFVLLLVGYIFLISPLGYFVVTPLYIIATYLYLKAMNFQKSALIAVGFTVFVYLLFVAFLHLPIPLGPME